MAAAKFSPSCVAPWFIAPSPIDTTQIRPVPVSFAASRDSRANRDTGADDRVFADEAASGGHQIRRACATAVHATRPLADLAHQFVEGMPHSIAQPWPR